MKKILILIFILLATPCYAQTLITSENELLIANQIQSAINFGLTVDESHEKIDGKASLVFRVKDGISVLRTYYKPISKIELTTAIDQEIAKLNSMIAELQAKKATIEAIQ